MKSILAAILLAITPIPATAGSWDDIESLTELIRGTGTQIVSSNCTEDLNRKGLHGFYVLDKDQKIDHLVFCTENVNTKDPNAVWEVLSHESTHIMQACHGGPILRDSFLPRAMRELQTFAPHYYALVRDDYANDHQRMELEAFSMELQEPAAVIETFKEFCYQ